MRKYIYIAIASCIAVLLALSCIFISKYKKSQKELSIALNNCSAYELMYSKEASKSRVFKLTIEQLNSCQDSLTSKIAELVSANKKLKKQLEAASYIQEVVYIRDSLFVRDTVLVKGTQLDTTITNEWYKLGLSLKYPNLISTNLSIENDKFILINASKETLKPRKKCFIARAFQKKHTVLNVEVIDKNPYVTNKNQRFIQILK